MDPSTAGLIVLAEQLAGLLIKTITDIKNVASGASSKTTDALLADADAQWDQIIANAKSAAAPPPAA